MKLVAYLAMPYSPLPAIDMGDGITQGPLTIDDNIKRARAIAIQLWEMGYAVICPHLNTAHFEELCTCSYEEYLAGDMEFLEMSDILVLGYDWNRSSGATKEFARAPNWQPLFRWPNVPYAWDMIEE